VNYFQLHTVYPILTDFVVIISLKKHAFAVKSRYEESVDVTIVFFIMKYPCSETH